MSETLPSAPKGKSRAVLVTLAILVGVGLTLWYGWKKPVEHLATQAIREALPRDVAVAKVKVNSPTSISLVGVERGPVAADEIKVSFSAISALKDGVASGVERVEIVRPTLRIAPREPGEGPAEWIVRVNEELQALIASETAGIGGASLAEAPVVITDGSLFAGDAVVVTGVKATLTPGPIGLSAQVNSALLHLGEAPWTLRGNYRPQADPAGASLHALRVLGTQGDADVTVSGTIGREAELAVEFRGVETAEIGRLLSASGVSSAALAPLADLGRADGTIALRGSLDRPEVLGQLSGKGAELGAGEPSAWRLEVSGGGDEPIDAHFLVDGDSMRAALAFDEGGDLRLSGEGLPVALVARLIALLLGADGVPEGLEGRADLDVQVVAPANGSPEGNFEVRLAQFGFGAVSTNDGLLAGTVRSSGGGGSFEFTGTFAGETSGEVAGAGTWTDGVVLGSLDVPWAYFRSFGFSDGEFLFESEPGGLAIAGTANAGGGTIELLDGFIGQGGFGGTFALAQGSAPAVVELLRSLSVTFPGDRTVRGTLSGVVEVTAAAEAGVGVSGRLESERLGYRDVSFHGASLAGNWSRNEWELSTLVLKQDESELTLSARGAGDYIEGEGVWTQGPAGSRARVAFSGGGRFSEDLRLIGRGVAGEGEIALDASWRPRDGKYAVAFDLSRFPLAIVIGSLSEGGDFGAASGPLLVTGDTKEWRAKADLIVSDVAYGDVSLQTGEFELDLGTEPGSEGHTGDPGCQGCLYGAGRLSGELALARESAAKRLDVRVEFNGDRGEVSALPLEVWGGRITGGGTLQLAGGEWGFDLRSEGKGLAYEDEGIDGLVDFALRLSGSKGAPAITGNVTVGQAKIDLLRLPNVPSLGGGSNRGGRGVGFDPSLDVSIEIQPAEVSAGTFLAGEMVGAVGVKGSAHEPQLFGEVALVRGDFRYLGSLFDAAAGRVRFRGGSLPELEMTGKRRVGGVDITASVAGPADDLKLTLTSEPPLSQSEILELLNVPTSVDLSEGWGELARSLANLANAELASQVYWRLGRAIEDVLDVDRFRLDQSDGALQLTIGKYVRPDLYLSYSRSLDGSANQDIAAEYRVGPNTTLTSEWDFEGRREVGIEVSAPF